MKRSRWTWRKPSGLERQRSGAKNLRDAGVPAGPIYNMEQVWEDEQVQAREMDVLLEHPKVGGTRNIGLAAKLYGSPGRIHSPAPLLGQHTREVLKESGFSEGRDRGIDQLGSGGSRVGRVDYSDIVLM